jgi:hypothetical protein
MVSTPLIYEGLTVNKYRKIVFDGQLVRLIDLSGNRPLDFFEWEKMLAVEAKAS